MVGCSYPAPLAPGARVHLVAPSSPFDRARFDAGLALVSARYRPVLAPSLFARAGFLAGDDVSRSADLAAALDDPEARALLAARGGYGATRLLPDLSPERVRAAGKWLVGFSDVTALHALWARAGVASIHGPVVCSLPRASEVVRDAWFALLEGETPPPLRDLSVVRAGRAAGRLFAGNLTVLAALVGTPYFPPLDGTVLALEDIGERPYRLDRALTCLLQAGMLAGVRAIVLGQFTDCDPGPDGTSVHDVLAERLRLLGIPIVASAPFGHVDDNTPLLLGSEACVDTSSRTVVFSQ